MERALKEAVSSARIKDDVTLSNMWWIGKTSGGILSVTHTEAVVAILSFLHNMDDLENMHNRWSIIADPNDYGLGIRVVLPDKDIVWPYIFEGLPLRSYPQVVS